MQINPSRKSDIRNLQYYLADDLKRLRQEKHLSLEDISEAAKISTGDLKNLELGYYKDWSLLLKIARFHNKRIKFVFY